MKCLKEKCIHHDVCALYTFSGYASDECGFYETKPHVENEKPQWIPCTDRLPDKTGYYLVSDRRGVVYSTSFDYLRMGKMCFGYDDLDGCFNEDNTVVAWMPLPTPYMKEGDQE